MPITITVHPSPVPFDFIRMTWSRQVRRRLSICRLILKIEPLEACFGGAVKTSAAIPKLRKVGRVHVS